MATKYFVAWQKREEVLEEKEHISFGLLISPSLSKCSVYKEIDSKYIIAIHLAQINRLVSL